MAAAKKQRFLRFLSDFCTELSLLVLVLNYKFGISVNTYQ